MVLHFQYQAVVIHKSLQKLVQWVLLTSLFEAKYVWLKLWVEQTKLSPVTTFLNTFLGVIESAKQITYLGQHY